MEGTYPVAFGRQPVGKVQVLRQGLYYRFVCRCKVNSQIVCRLMVNCGNATESLGIVVPMDDGFGLETRLPVKRFSAGEVSFSLVPKLEQTGEKFYPIYPEEPFAYVAKLKESYLCYREGQAGIVVY